jgi:hypothetical protein
VAYRLCQSVIELVEFESSAYDLFSFFLVELQRLLRCPEQVRLSFIKYIIIHFLKMENTNEYMTKEKIEAMVAKRVFGLFYGDEWSSFIFSKVKPPNSEHLKIERNKKI